METIIDLIKDQWLFIGFVLSAVVAVLLSVFTVDQQEVAIITRFGKFVRLAHAGLNFKVPFIEDVAGTTSLRVEQLDVQVTTKTKDNVFVTLLISVQHVAIRERIQDAFYKLDDVDGQMTAYVSDAVRAKVPSLDLDDAFERKDDIAEAVQEALSAAMTENGWRIIKALVTDISPDEKVVTAMNEINAARREQVAAQARAEGERTLTVTAARANAEAMALEGKGIADQRKAILEGLAASVKELEDTIPGVSAEQIMNTIMMTRYFETLQTMATSGGVNTIMLPSSPGALADLREQIIAGIAAGKTLPSPMPAKDADPREDAAT